MRTYTIELSGEDCKNKEKMKDLNEIMDKFQDEHNLYIRKFAEENNLSFICADHVLYLRGRSRWTQELENELIRLHKEGNPPNIFEFGN